MIVLPRNMLLGVALLFGCGPDYGGLEVATEGVVLAGDDANSRRFRVAVGHVLRIHARPRSQSSASYDRVESVELRPGNSDLIRIYRDEEPWRWTLVGRAFGQTCVDVWIDGSKEACIETFIRSGDG